MPASRGKPGKPVAKLTSGDAPPLAKVEVSGSEAEYVMPRKRLS
jgi:hypothetical protein